MGTKNKNVKVYRIFRPNESFDVEGANRDDAIYNLHIKTGMPEDFIKKQFMVKRVYRQG